MGSKRSWGECWYPELRSKSYGSQFASEALLTVIIFVACLLIITAMQLESSLFLASSIFLCLAFRRHKQQHVDEILLLWENSLLKLYCEIHLCLKKKKEKTCRVYGVITSLL